MSELPDPTGDTDGRSVRPDARVICYLAVLLLVHAALLAYSAAIHSPTYDEVGHLPAGVGFLTTGRADLYRVNPPLVRAVAAIPAWWSGCTIEYANTSKAIGHRNEFSVGQDVFRRYGERAFQWTTRGRWMCILFSLLGMLVCYWWVRDLYGRRAGALAATLWCFSPSVLAHGALLTPDMAPTSIGALAMYWLWQWTRAPDSFLAVRAGIGTGLMLLTKFTWLIALPLLPLLALVALGWQVFRPRMLGHLIMIYAAALLTLNLGYGFDGTWTKLGDYNFVSHALSGGDHLHRMHLERMNVFRDTVWGEIPLPLPRNVVLGVDIQRFDFDSKWPSYMRGEWRDVGWYYFYAYGVLIKEPLGWLVMLPLAALVTALSGTFRAGGRNEWFLLLPAITVFVFVSSQVGFTHHLRYVLPCYPFVFIWMSKLARAVETRWWKTAGLSGVLLLWGIASSLSIYPHSLCYFNELIGGPKNGHWHVGSSCTDWGQNVFLLKDWLEEHPEVTLDGLTLDGTPLAPQDFGWDFPMVPVTDEFLEVLGNRRPRPPGGAPRVGWYAISVNSPHAMHQPYHYLLNEEAVACIGYSINIYHLTPANVERLRREMKERD